MKQYFLNGVLCVAQTTLAWKYRADNEAVISPVGNKMILPSPQNSEVV